MMRAVVASLILLTLTFIPKEAALAKDVYEPVLSKDLKDARDHPLTGRYGGSTLVLQSRAAFDELILPAGKAVSTGGKRFSETVTAQGQVTRSIYAIAPGRSTLEVSRNFEDHLKNLGFTVVFQCAGNDGCGDAFKELKYHWNNKATHVSAGSDTSPRRALSHSIFDGGRDIRYALLRKGQDAQATYVALFVARSEGGSYGDISKALTGYVLALVEVVEPKPMEMKIETLKSEAIAAGLHTDGSVALYGLLFDTNKSTLKPESDQQIEEMVRFLKASNANVYVVGHTDNQGKLDYNLDLSERRAKTVAQALTARGIAANRIIARGVGPLSPVSSNADEAGRAKNRRVELVLQ